MSEFLPRMEFQPFTGEIEDNNDPLMIGRVRVRAHGYHSQSTSDISTEDLPWAMVAYSRSDAISVPAVGEWVFGYFLDGNERQKPMVVGVIPGIVNEEPTTNRRARNEEVDDTDVASKKSETVSHGNLEEPESPYDAKYPNNHSFFTPAGHLVEIDDTEGKERIHIYHSTGSFEEYHPNGQRVQRIEGDNYEANKSNKYTITLGNNEASTKGNKESQVDGNTTERSDGNVETTMGGTFKVESDTGALIEFDNTGLLKIENSSHNLSDSLNTIIDIILNMQTVGSPANHIPYPKTLADLAAEKVKLKTFLK